MHGNDSRKTLKVLKTLTLLACLSVAAPNAVKADAHLPGEGVSVTPSYEGLLEGVFQTEVVLIGLERLGYTVNDLVFGEGVAYLLAVAQGDADLTAVHWVPQENTTFENAGGTDKMTRLGVVVANATQGYLIDRKTAEELGITNIEQFQDPAIAARFDSDGDEKANLTGCPPGWGCELIIEHHLDTYGLRDTVTHDQGQFTVLAADVAARYKAGESVLFYTYTPLWFSQIIVPGKDVVWLEVPFTSVPEDMASPDLVTTLPDGRNVGWGLQNITIVGNNEFLAANPAAKRFLELVTIPIEDVDLENLLIHNGEDSREDVRRHAQDWVAANQEQFDGWIADAKAAAQ